MVRIRQGSHSSGDSDCLSSTKSENTGGSAKSDCTYGCNMAFRTAAIGSLRFDERLPLYGWQEELGFLRSAAAAPAGSFGRTASGEFTLAQNTGRVASLDLGTRRSSIRPILSAKATCRFGTAFRLMARNLLANLVGSIRPESCVDRRGRLRGNLIGMFHLMTGRNSARNTLGS